MAHRDEAVAAFLAARDSACPHCGYNLRGVTSKACPECGTGLALRLELVRRWRPAMTILALVLVWLVLAGGINATRAGFDIAAAGRPAPAVPRGQALLQQRVVQQQLRLQLLQQPRQRHSTSGEPQIMLPTYPPQHVPSPNSAPMTTQTPWPQVNARAWVPPAAPPAGFNWGAAAPVEYVRASAWSLFGLAGLTGLLLLVLSKRAGGERHLRRASIIGVACVGILACHHLVTFAGEVMAQFT